MASRFASVSGEESISVNEEVVPKNRKMAPNFGLTVFNSKLFNLSNHIPSSLRARMCIARRARFYLSDHLYIVKNKVIFGLLDIQLVWYILKQLFTSVSVKSGRYL